MLDNFNGGDAVIGIHGTDDPSSIGKDISHGCIRMNNADITRARREVAVAARHACVYPRVTMSAPTPGSVWP